VSRPEGLAVKWTMDALELLAFQPLSAPQVAAAMQIHPRTARPVVELAAALTRRLEEADA
jgi:hypothetical protein